VTTYAELGVRPLINAATSWTTVGGTLMAPEVFDAMRAAGQAFVDMHELQELAGAEVARLTNNDAAYITCGAAAAISLGVLAARTHGDPLAISRLMSGDELPDEVVMHTAHRVPYDPAVRLAGARIRTVGNVLQTFEHELEATISQRTAAILYVVGGFVAPGALSLETVVRVAHAHGVPVIVDAAGQLPPVENLWRFTKQAGADMAVFSGGKELCGPQASGLILGGRSWIEAVRANGSPHQRLARALKVGKEEIMGLVTAVGQFVATDHDRRWVDLHERSDRLARMLGGIEGVTTCVEDTNAAGARLPRVRVTIDPVAVGSTASAVVARLWDGEPRIAVRAGRGEYFHVELGLVTEGEEEVVRRRLAEELAANPAHR